MEKTDRRYTDTNAQTAKDISGGGKRVKGNEISIFRELVRKGEYWRQRIGTQNERAYRKRHIRDQSPADHEGGSRKVHAMATE